MIQSINDVRLKRQATSCKKKPENEKHTSFKKQIALTKAFGYAFFGLFLFFKMERNGKIQLSLALLVTAFGIALQISAQEWIYVLLCIAVVLSLEMLNSAIEKLCDMVCAEYNTTIKIVKDVSAGAVLWTSLISLIVAAIIFLPKITTLCFPK